MENNDILIRLRYALDIKDTDMVKIFELGGVTLTKDEVKERLTKDSENHSTNKDLESFLNGFIIFKRGVQESKDGQAPTPPPEPPRHLNNMLLRKVKIALNMTSDDMHEIFDLAELHVGKSELTAFFRKEGHKHYRECKDKFARNFLKGLALKYRK